MRCSVGLVVVALTITGVTCETRSVPRRSKADCFSASEFSTQFLALGAPVLVTDAAADWPIMQWTNASGVAAVAEKLSCGTSTRVWSEASEGKLADASEDGGSGDVVSVSSSCAGDTSWSDLGLHGRPYFLDQSEEGGTQGGEGLVVERRGAATDAVESWEDAQCACSFSIQVCGHARAVCMCLCVVCQCDAQRVHENRGDKEQTDQRESESLRDWLRFHPSNTNRQTDPPQPSHTSARAQTTD